MQLHTSHQLRQRHNIAVKAAPFGRSDGAKARRPALKSLIVRFVEISPAATGRKLPVGFLDSSRISKGERCRVVINSK